MQQTLKALAALAQEHRLMIFRLLVQAGDAGLGVGDIRERLGLPKPTLSFHLKELASAGLIEGRSQGRFVFYRARYDTMNQLIGFLTENCCAGTACVVEAAPVCCPALVRENDCGKK